MRPKLKMDIQFYWRATPIIAQHKLSNYLGFMKPDLFLILLIFFRRALATLQTICNTGAEVKPQGFAEQKTIKNNICHMSANSISTSANPKSFAQSWAH